MYKYDQMSHAHQYDLWDHSLHTVYNLLETFSIKDGDIRNMLYLGAFLHDIGKPSCRVPDKKGRTDENGNLNHFHYYGHAAMGAKIVDEFTLCNKNIDIDHNQRCLLHFFITHHDDELSLKPSSISHIANAIKKEVPDKYDNEEVFDSLIRLELADAQAHVISAHKKIRDRVTMCKFLRSDLGRGIFRYINKNGCNGMGKITSIKTPEILLSSSNWLEDMQILKDLLTT